MKDSELLDQCIAYFKNNSGFERLLTKIKEKYKSLGKIGGKVVLTGLSCSEQEALTGFFRKDYTRQKQLTIKLAQFEQALAGTRFAGLKLEDILKAYYAQAEIISNKKERTLYLEQREAFFRQIVAQLAGSIAGDWIEDLLNKRNNAYSLLITRYNLDQEKLNLDIRHIARAMASLPVRQGEKRSLALFASQITKNPHAFDQGTEGSILMQYALSYYFDVEKPRNAEERAELYYQAGLLVNEVANYTNCCGLQAYLAGSIHPGWSGFYSTGESMLVSLRNLGQLDRVVSPGGRVFVLENPTVFSSILDQQPGRQLPLICTNGQVRLASLVLLDMLAEEGTKIYYSGDFDPEGLLIADRLKRRYGQRLTLWRYRPADYQLALSGQVIAPGRFSKLKGITDKQLQETGDCLQKHGVAGYQELLLELLLEDILVNY